MKHSGASAQQRKASEPGINAWVAANAGSGKTRVLVDRVIRLLLDGAEPERILCLTFTKAAAAEMANRLFERLGQWIRLDDKALAAAISALGADKVDRKLLDRARTLFTVSLETPGGLKIQTIHAFCERLLQLFPIEAGVAPGFEVMDDRQVQEMLELARREVLTEAQSDVSRGLSQALLKIIPYAKEEEFDALVQAILGKRGDLPAFLAEPGGVTAAVALLRAGMGRPPDLTLDDVSALLTVDHDRYRALADALQHGKPGDRERASDIVEILAKPDSQLDALAGILLTKKNAPKTIQGIATKAVTSAEPWIADFVAMEQERLLAALALRSDLLMLDSTEALLSLATAIIARYETAKRAQGRYDFDDLIARTRALLTRAGAAEWVLYKLDGGIDHILIDEAQDTSPAQWDIAEALVSEIFSGRGARAHVERTLFAVGDRKQSIFSFQGADPDAFVEASNRFEIKITSSGKTFRRIPLHVSYRSTQRVLRAVDLVFAQDAARRGVEARGDTAIEHRAHREEAHGLVEIWPLTLPDEQAEETHWRAPVDTEPQNHPRRKLAAKIARRISGWIGRRMLPSLGRTVRAGDILILVRRRNAFFDALIQELHQHGVAVAGADRLRLSEHIAIRDVLALAQFTLLPEDDYALACVLKSPLVARQDGTPIDDDDLFALAHGRGTTSLWQRLRQAQDPRLVPAREYLEHWLALAPALAPFAFFSRLLVESRADILKRLGPEANDPLDALLDLTIDFEHGHAPTLPAFLVWFLSGETEIKRDMDQGADEVRVMTVHGAKGLESHIVMLPDTVDVPDGRQGPNILMVRPIADGPQIPLWVLPKMAKSGAVQAWCDARQDNAGDEYRRLLYVAMTRARDELYVGGWRGRSDPKPDCWYTLMRQAIEREGVAYTDADGELITRIGPEDIYASEFTTAQASLVLMPGWLRQPVTPQRTPPAAISAFSTPAPSEISAERQEALVRGRLVHRLLQLLPDMPSERRRAAARHLVEREGQGEELANAVLGLFDIPEMASFLAPGGLAEVPVAMRDRAGGLVAGQIDRLTVTAEEVLILDYKSDIRPPPSLDQVKPAYLSQMAAYRAAMRQAFPDRRVRAALLWTALPALMPLPDPLLDKAAMRSAEDHEPVREP
jgi:ATP-dependent helicase/nuclease subunit A